MSEGKPDSQTTKLMICRNCWKAVDMKIARFRTASPQHVDLECTCPNCGTTWPAAEDADAKA